MHARSFVWFVLMSILSMMGFRPISTAPLALSPLRMISVNIGSELSLATWYQQPAEGSFGKAGAIGDDSVGGEHLKSAAVGKFTHDAVADVLITYELRDTRVFVVFASNGYGQFFEKSIWLSVPKDSVRVVLPGDIDGDGDADVVLGNIDNSGHYQWRWCENVNTGLQLCTPWQNTSNNTGNFGKAGDTVLLADLDGNGMVELLRGTPQNISCDLGNMQWERMSGSGHVDVVAGCWGYHGGQFLAQDVNNDGVDEIVAIHRTTDSSVAAFVGAYHPKINRFTSHQWASNVGTMDDVYVLADIDDDAHLVP